MALKRGGGGGTGGRGCVRYREGKASIDILCGCIDDVYCPRAVRVHNAYSSKGSNNNAIHKAQGGGTG